MVKKIRLKVLENYLIVEKYEFSTHDISDEEYLKVHLMVALQTTSRRMMMMSLLWSRLKESLGIDVLPKTNIELMKEDAPYIPSIISYKRKKRYE